MATLTFNTENMTSFGLMQGLERVRNNYTNGQFQGNPHTSEAAMQAAMFITANVSNLEERAYYLALIGVMIGAPVGSELFSNAYFELAQGLDAIQSSR